MRYILFFLLSFACSTNKNSGSKDNTITPTSSSFKKEIVLTNSQVRDYYENSFKAMNPALQDETIDRFKQSELNQIQVSSDPLLEISLKCQKKDFEGAFQSASLQFNRYQKTAAYWNQIANCHLMKGSYRSALLFYNKALEVSPNYVPALNNIGVMYSKQGYDQKALVAFERAYKQSKFSKTPRYNLGRLYLAYGLTDLAMPIFQSLINASQDDVELLNSIAITLLIKSRFEEALSFYDRIPRSEWSNPEIGLNLSLLFLKLGKSQDADEVFKKINYPKSEKLKNYYELVRNKMGEIK